MSYIDISEQKPIRGLNGKISFRATTISAGRTILQTYTRSLYD